MSVAAVNTNGSLLLLLPGPVSSSADSSSSFAAALAEVSGDPYANDIASASAQTGVPATLIRAVIGQEDGSEDPSVVSPAGAVGMMQLEPGTAAELGVNPYDPAQNILGGAKYLKGLLSRYDGNVELALAAYNAGPNAVDKYGGIPPYAETEQYVSKVMGNYQRLQQATPAPTVAPPTSSTPALSPATTATTDTAPSAGQDTSMNSLNGLLSSEAAQALVANELSLLTSVEGTSE